jgi:uncharacterized DUF497 family protein
MERQFEYDPEKSRSNEERHGVNFVEAQELWKVAHVVIAAKVVAEEVRKVILGEIGGKIYAAVFTMRDQNIRLISCHRADERWERVYEQDIEEES